MILKKLFHKSAGPQCNKKKSELGRREWKVGLTIRYKSAIIVKEEITCSFSEVGTKILRLSINS